MKKLTRSKRSIKMTLLTVIFGVITIATSVYADNKLKPSEAEATLPMKISQTDMKVDVSIVSVVKKTEGKEEAQKIADSKMSKIEVYRKSVDTTNIAITYKVTVTNIGNATGNVDKVYVILPKEINESLADWRQKSSSVLTSADFGELGPNQSVSKNITISDNTNNLIGENAIVAIVTSKEDINQRIIQDDEEGELDETQAESELKGTNNYDSASMIVSISTGTKWIKVLGIILIILLILAIGLRIDKKIFDKMNPNKEKNL